MANQTNADTWYFDLSIPPKSRWARLPFAVRMSICGCATVLGVASAVGALVAGPGALVALTGQAAPADAPAHRAGQAESVSAGPAQPKAGAVPAARTGLGQSARGGTGVPVTGGPTGATGLVVALPATGGLPGAPTAATGGLPGTAGMPAGGTPASAASVVVTEVVTETEDIAYQTTVVRDGSLPRGGWRVRTAGVPGTRTLRYEVTTVDGQPAGRRLIESTVTTQPVARVIAVGPRDGRDHPAGACRHHGGDERCPPRR